VSGVAVVSFRLGGTDGVAVEASKWASALRSLGHSVRTVAGEGSADVLLPGLAMLAPEAPTEAEVADSLAGADLVVVENLCSLPLNPRAADLVARALRGRPAILRHHDLPWQRPQFAGMPPPPDDPAWVHVTINDLSRRQLADRGIDAVTVYNAFDPDPPAGDREATRAALDLGSGDRLVVQPTRAIARKNVPLGLRLAEEIGAVYWLVGPAEEGYDDELEGLLLSARVRVVHRYPDAVARLGPPRSGAAVSLVAHAYAASDAVVLPSTWEGFGNPSVESALHRRPLAIGDYPVAAELATFGFRWFSASDPGPIEAWLDRPEGTLLDHNAGIARRTFSIRDLPGRLSRMMEQAGWDLT
jgi:glycosyltransferase involved in cell wall biosynthesis